jgi:hypothetical protein
MSRDNLEFNTIKTVGTINKDSILQKVFKKKFGDYNPNKLTEEAKANSLADETIKFLKGVFNDVILNREELLEKYNEVKISNKTPRRYGKTKILSDIEAKNGVATPLQKTMLNLGKLKTLNTNLIDKGVSDHYRGTKNLSDKDLRAINAAIRDFEKKISMIK